MNDLISREDALTALNGACSNWQDDSKVADIISGLPSAKVTGDLISRADAIEAVRVCDVFLAYQGDKIANNIDGFVDSMVEQMRDNISRAVSALPSAETTGALDDAIAKYVADGLMELPSAEAEPKRVLQGYCKGADCKWWNPQVDGCNRCVMVKDEYTHPSAEAVQGWIPCSERLPDVDVEVLATVDWSDVLIVWLKKDGTWETDEYILDHDEIIAWMPLPKPYKGGDSE